MRARTYGALTLALTSPPRVCRVTVVNSVSMEPPRIACIGNVASVRFRDGDLDKLGAFVDTWASLEDCTDHPEGTAEWFCDRMDTYAAIFATFMPQTPIPLGDDGKVQLQSPDRARQYKYLRLARAMLAHRAPFKGRERVTCKRLAEISPDSGARKWLAQVPGDLPVDVF